MASPLRTITLGYATEFRACASHSLYLGRWAWLSKNLKHRPEIILIAFPAVVTRGEAYILASTTDMATFISWRGIGQELTVPSRSTSTLHIRNPDPRPFYPFYALHVNARPARFPICSVACHKVGRSQGGDRPPPFTVPFFVTRGGLIPLKILVQHCLC